MGNSRDAEYLNGLLKLKRNRRGASTVADWLTEQRVGDAAPPVFADLFFGAGGDAAATAALPAVTATAPAVSAEGAASASAAGVNVSATAPQATAVGAADTSTALESVVTSAAAVTAAGDGSVDSGVGTVLASPAAASASGLAGGTDGNATAALPEVTATAFSAVAEAVGDGGSLPDWVIAELAKPLRRDVVAVAAMGSATVRAISATATGGQSANAMAAGVVSVIARAAVQARATGHAVATAGMSRQVILAPAAFARDESVLARRRIAAMVGLKLAA